MRIFILRRCVSLPRQGRAMINVLQSGEHFYQFFPYRPLKFVIFHREFLRFWFFNISKYTRFADRHSGERRKKKKKNERIPRAFKEYFFYFFLIWDTRINDFHQILIASISACRLNAFAYSIHRSARHPRFIIFAVT